MASIYRSGQQYVDVLVEALRSALAYDPELASDLVDQADGLLGPLGDEADPENLRDFIAGTANATEHYLRQLGVHIKSDGPLAPPGT